MKLSLKNFLKIVTINVCLNLLNCKIGKDYRFFEKKAEKTIRIGSNVSENFLKNGLNPDDFSYGDTIYEREYTKIVKVTHKKTAKNLCCEDDNYAIEI